MHTRRQSVIQPQIFESKKIENKPLIDKEKQKKNFQEAYDLMMKLHTKSSQTLLTEGSPNQPAKEKLTVDNNNDASSFSPIAFSPSQFSQGKGGLRPFVLLTFLDMIFFLT